jgi:nucleoside-diphosphate-sugar epimerase
MKKILLLGGSGYIGSKFYYTYNNQYDIESVDLQLFKQDSYSICKNYNDLVSITEYDTIICFAAHSSVPMCEYSPSRAWINNVEYFKNLCQKISPEQKLIYMSSASIYGNTSNIATEEYSVNMYPIKNYDLHKIIIDIIANKYILEDKNIIGLRLGTVNGSSPHTRKELMLNSMTINALEHGYIKIKNLNMKRSILGINDLMRAMSYLIENKAESGQYNLCSFTYNVKELAESVVDICSAKIIEEPSDKVFYSFEMSTSKFCDTYQFNFRDTPSSIIKELLDNHKNTIYSERNHDANFEQYV